MNAAIKGALLPNSVEHQWIERKASFIVKWITDFKASSHYKPSISLDNFNSYVKDGIYNVQ